MDASQHGNRWVEAAKDGNGILFVGIHARFTAGIHSSAALRSSNKMRFTFNFLQLFAVKAAED